MVMVINFADSDFSMYIMDAAKRYCNKYYELVKYWENSRQDYAKKLTEVYSDVHNIQDFFVKNIVGDWIKNLEKRDFLDTHMFEHILKYTKEMFDDDRFTILSDCEFDKSQLGYCEYLVLYFQNDNLNYDIF